ncbi:cytochrome c peroxidase [Nibrella viscosa]|uniref:Cytochrome c peroxidase n=1 Tax=Nibrella viscosa TaxID=1084524 RepID=A0ABP8K9X3_9BACT
MKDLVRIALLLAGGLAGLLACQLNHADTDEPVTPTPPTGGSFQATPYPWQPPAHFPDMVYDLSKNPLTYEGVQLGKTLFYDGLLSRNGTISCGFCHSPFTAFAHTDHALSHGIDDRIGTRNVPGIQNVAWSKNFFWDGGVVHLDLLPIAPIQHPDEMGDSLANVLRKVGNSGRYRPLFKAAYGTEEVTSERLLKALSQFMLTMVSANSKYDKYLRKESGGTLTDAEQRGLSLFTQHCAGCHAGPLQTDQRFRNNGLPPAPADRPADLGRYAITLRPEDRFAFRVPSLRNVQMTPPYMHDGRFQTLEQVLQHYAGGVVDSPTLDPQLKANGKTGIPLSAGEQRDLIQFLYTLTDYDFITNRQLQPN